MLSDGFSLLELLVVIAISAILASIGIQSWQEVKQRDELSSVTLALFHFLNEVQLDANTHNRNHYIYYFEYNQHWCFAVATEERPLSCSGQWQFSNPIESVSIQGMNDNQFLGFYGLRNMAKTGTIRLRNDIGESHIVIANRGRIRFCSENTYLAGFPPC